MRSAPIRIAILALVAACVGCPANLENPERFALDAALDCPDVPQDVLLKSCGIGGCHSTVDKMLGLDLQAPDVASRLVGVHATGGSGLLIDPSNPTMSILYEKLFATPPFGIQMPDGQKPLDPKTVACVLQWINDRERGRGRRRERPTGTRSSLRRTTARPPSDGPGSDDEALDPAPDAAAGVDATRTPASRRRMRA